MATLLNQELLDVLERLSMAPRSLRSARRIGRHVSRARGRSVEFADYRSYQPGDDFRYIDWNLYLRLGRPFVKVFSSEDDQLIHLIIDASASMGFGTKLDHALRLAAALGYVGLAQQDSVVVSAFRNDIHASSPIMRGRVRIHDLFDKLSDIRADGTTSFDEALGRYARRVPRRGRAIVFSDLLDETGYQAGLRAMRIQGYDLSVFHLIDKSDIDPGGRGSVLLEDAETGAELEMAIGSSQLTEMAAAVSAFADEAARFCHGQNIEYVRVSTDRPFQETLFSYLQGEQLR
jgi:uncharacterized protein (DUF58 family)